MTDQQTKFKNTDIVIAPREICLSCHNLSGIKFSLSNLRGPTELHRANIIPTGPERELAEVNMQYAKSESRRLNHEISLLVKSLKALKERREALRDFYARERSMFAPIRKLPEEILRRIFLEAKLDSDYTGWTLVHERDSFVRTVTQISTYWRKVAQSCAFLWSRVHEQRSFRHMTAAEIRASSAFLERCVVFSKEAAFSVRIGNMTCTPENLGTCCVQALAQCAHRWRKSDISSGELLQTIINRIPPTVTSFEQLLSFTIGDIYGPISLLPTPKLTTLSIKTMSDTSNEINLQHAPLLTHLNFSIVTVPSRVLEGSIIWSQITDFEAHYNEYLAGELTVILGRMPNLVNLTLKGELNTEVAVTLPQLEKLKLYDDSDCNAFDILTTPALKELQLNYYQHTANADEFVRRSGCSIEELRIDSMSVAEVWGRSEFDSVKTFDWDTLGSPESDLQIIEWLTPAGQKCNLPRLENLTLRHICYDKDVSSESVVDSLVAMIISRLRSTSPCSDDDNSSHMECPLKSINITLDSSSIDDTILEEFVDFFQSDIVHSSGVEITVTDFNLGECIVSTAD